MPLVISIDYKKFNINDLLLSLNDHPVNDIIDLRFYLHDKNKVKLKRNNKQVEISATDEDIRQLCFIQDIPNIKKCINECSFCFVDQLDKGMREKVYFKDDDWRLSFLSGNFITLTNLSNKEIDRIIKQRISPLYISIHATDVETRKKLGLKNPEISIDNFKKLDESSILTHVQIVLCPGVNDESMLDNTLNDLSLMKNVRSVGIVPVGITRFHSNNLSSVTKEQAIGIIKFINNKRDLYMNEKNYEWIYLADEFYLLADVEMPSSSYYDDFEQLENGIGLVRQWLDSFDISKVSTKSKFSIVTAKLFSSVLKHLFKDFKNIDILTVTNRFFGEKITVAGLITAQDILNQIKPKITPILIPDIVLNEHDLFLDNVSFVQLKKSLPSATIVPSTGGSFQKWLENNF